MSDPGKFDSQKRYIKEKRTLMSVHNDTAERLRDFCDSIGVDPDASWDTRINEVLDIF